MKKIDIVCDIETLGTKPGSAIIQIAAIAGSFVDNKTYAVFNEYIKPDKTSNIDLDTVVWWSTKNSELFKKILEAGKINEHDAIAKFVSWMEDVRKDVADNEEDKKAELLFWGNGALFDNIFIKTSCEKYGVTYPIKYWNDRDLRTLYSLYAIKHNISEKELKEKLAPAGFVAHDALNDAELEFIVGTKVFEDLLK